MDGGQAGLGSADADLLKAEGGKGLDAEGVMSGGVAYGTSPQGKSRGACGRVRGGEKVGGRGLASMVGLTRFFSWPGARRSVTQKGWQWGDRFCAWMPSGWLSASRGSGSWQRFGWLADAGDTARRRRRRRLGYEQGEYHTTVVPGGMRRAMIARSGSLQIRIRLSKGCGGASPRLFRTHVRWANVGTRPSFLRFVWVEGLGLRFWLSTSLGKRARYGHPGLLAGKGF